MTATAEIHELESGQLLRTHPVAASCAISFCAIHNPSLHPLHRAPRVWDPNQSLILRVCEHGIGHPDPDDVRLEALIDCVCGCNCCGYPRGVGRVIDPPSPPCPASA